MICSDFRQRFTSVLLILERPMTASHSNAGADRKSLQRHCSDSMLEDIHALAAQSCYTLVPCEKHSLAGILKSGVTCHSFSHPRRDIRNRITDRFDDFDLCFDGNAKCGGDELSETLTRTPGFLCP